MAALMLPLRALLRLLRLLESTVTRRDDDTRLLRIHVGRSDRDRGVERSEARREELVHFVRRLRRWDHCRFERRTGAAILVSSPSLPTGPSRDGDRPFEPRRERR